MNSVFGISRLRVLGQHLLMLAVSSAFITPQAGFAWGPEGHKAIAILAARYMHPDALRRVRGLLDRESIEDASLWADDIAHSSRTDTAVWHYIDIPLRSSTIELRRDCPAGQCVLVKTEEFLATLSRPQASSAARREALRFVLHFVADIHQPLHCEDNHDKGGNAQPVIFNGHPDNLHWVWDTGLVQEINPDPRSLATALAAEITSRDRAAWQEGGIRDWVLESHRLAQTVAYDHLPLARIPTLSPAYDHRAEAVIRLQIAKASVRLARVLNEHLAAANSDFAGH